MTTSDTGGKMVRDRMLTVACEGGKYHWILYEQSGNFGYMRYQQNFHNETGNKAVLALFSRVFELEERIERAKCCLVTAPIADPLEVYSNTLGILEGVK